MAQTIRINEIKDHDGQEVTLQGWIYNKTDKGKLVFLLLRDGSGFAQCVAFKNDLPAEEFESLGLLAQESALTIQLQLLNAGSNYLGG